MELNTLMLEGKALADIPSREELQSKYNSWCSNVRVYMNEAGFTEKAQESVKVKMHYTENEYSENDTILSLKKSLAAVIQTLEENNLLFEQKLPDQEELRLIEQILDNFYMYYRAMYQSPVHKRSTLKMDDLTAIRIGNEYDLQRMLYSILLPIFPTLRQEVYSDNGYGGMRADLYLEQHNLVIETKCTRESMSEKQLIEELGADGFHYHADILYFFVYDKIGLIKNAEAFKSAFERKPQEGGKTVKVFILQPTDL